MSWNENWQANLKCHFIHNIPIWAALQLNLGCCGEKLIPLKATAQPHIALVHKDWIGPLRLSYLGTLSFSTDETSSCDELNGITKRSFKSNTSQYSESIIRHFTVFLLTPATHSSKISTYCLTVILMWSDDMRMDLLPYKPGAWAKFFRCSWFLVIGLVIYQVKKTLKITKIIMNKQMYIEQAGLEMRKATCHSAASQKITMS